MLLIWPVSYTHLDVYKRQGEKLYPFILTENNYSEETSLQGFSQVEVKALEKMLVRVRENITGDWEAVKKGQKRNY